VADPFLKWAGGKRRLLPRLRELVPDPGRRYFEPFLGGGALFFALEPKRAVLSDVNEELIATYLAIQSNAEEVIAELKGGRYQNSEDAYYAIRAAEPVFDVHKAARFIYLNRTGFNGLYRVNKRGKFNVPFGHQKNPTICDEARLRSASETLNRGSVRILHRTFDAVLELAKAGDVVYFDPPYWPVSKTANFAAFSAVGFGPDDQRRLRDTALLLHRRGVIVVLSGSDAPEVRDLYADSRFVIHKVQARRSINCDGKKRGPVGEVIITMKS